MGEVRGLGAGASVGTVTAYRVLMLGNGVSCVIGAVALGWLPRYEPLPGAREESPFTALRDRPFVAYAVPWSCCTRCGSASGCRPCAKAVPRSAGRG